jgi:hypothetical protein
VWFACASSSSLQTVQKDFALFCEYTGTGYIVCTRSEYHYFVPTNAPIIVVVLVPVVLHHTVALLLAKRPIFRHVGHTRDRDGSFRVKIRRIKIILVNKNAPRPN